MYNLFSKRGIKLPWLANVQCKLLLKDVSVEMGDIKVEVSAGKFGLFVLCLQICGQDLLVAVTCRTGPV